MKKITLIASCFMASFGIMNAQNSGKTGPLYNATNNTEHTNATQGNCDATVPSNNFEGGRQCSANNNWTSAVDLVIPADNDITLSSIVPSVGMEAGVTATSVLVTIYENANGVPGTELNSQTVVPTSQTYQGSNFGVDFSDVLLDLSPVELPGSAGSEINYWVAIQVTTSDNTTAYIETTTADAIGNPLTFSDGNAFIVPDVTKEGVYSVTADCTPITGNSFPVPYCGPLVFGTVEPITLVEVAGISNVSEAAIDGSDSHEDYVAITGEMEQGASYSIALEGNTAGDYSDRFVVFIDWNQNDALDDEGEVYVIDEALVNSTGTDGKQVIGSINVPVDALTGTTRMRVKKTYEEPKTAPCAAGSNWGQTEDYSINVSTLGVSENDALANFSYYPNPTSDVLTLNATKTIDAVAVFNLLGQKVLDTEIEATNSEINLSSLTTGTYIMKVTVAGELGTYKVIIE